MARLPELTEAEIKEWFDLERYPTDGLSSLGLAGWVQVLSDRLVLRGFVDSGRGGYVIEGLTNLAEAPLRSLGMDLPLVHGEHPTDTPTVYFARTNVLRLATMLADQKNINGDDCYDLALQQAEGNHPMKLVNINVDLGATRTQIKADFNRWLDGVVKLQKPPTQRNYSNQSAAIAEWIEHKYLPYFDLTLVADFQKKRISTETMAWVLGLTTGRNPPDATDALKAPRKSLEVFTWETVHAMWRQRDAEK